MPIYTCRYDNVFIYTQPGNGKLNIKEPIKQVKTAIAKLDEVIGIVSAL